MSSCVTQELRYRYWTSCCLERGRGHLQGGEWSQHGRLIKKLQSFILFLTCIFYIKDLTTSVAVLWLINQDNLFSSLLPLQKMAAMEEAFETIMTTIKTNVFSVFVDMIWMKTTSVSL